MHAKVVKEDNITDDVGHFVRKMEKTGVQSHPKRTVWEAVLRSILAFKPKMV